MTGEEGVVTSFIIDGEGIVTRNNLDEKTLANVVITGK